MKKTLNIHKRLIVLILSLLVLTSSLSAFKNVYADNRYSFDNVNVLDDLESSAEFKLEDYPKDESGNEKSAKVINFVEWCYSPYVKGDFALYVYFYNPQGLKIDGASPSNRIQMATAYKNADGTPADVPSKDTTPSNYDTFPVVFCNASERAGYEGLFYKFRVVDQKGADGKSIEERVNPSQRRYDVSGLVLTLKNGEYREFTVGGTYIFTGYSAGYGANPDGISTLTCADYIELETLRLDVNHTNYRTESSSEGAGHQNDINTVYFNIPNKYLNNYGKLQKIKAEWHEYETQPVYVFDNEKYTKGYLSVAGKTLKDNYYWTNLGFWTARVEMRGFGDSTTHRAYNAYNCPNNSKIILTSWRNSVYYAFTGDFSNKILVTSDELQNYVETYTASAERGYLPVKNGNISADLFKEGLSSTRANVPYVGEDIHYKRVEIDANDKFDILSYNENHNFIQKLWDYGFSWPSDTSIEDVAPIIYGDSVNNALTGTTATAISNKLLINESDVKKFKEVYNDGKNNSETTVLFRFALTDYAHEDQNVWFNNVILFMNDGGTEKVKVFNQTVFLDFKVIQLTFQDDNANFKVVPVTQNPFDIYNDITNTPLNVPWWWAWVTLAVVIGLVAILGTSASKIASILNVGRGNSIIRQIFVIAFYVILGLAFYFILSTGIYLIVYLGGL